MNQHTNTKTNIKINTYGMGKKTLATYLIGLCLSFLFTVCAFSIVSHQTFSIEYRFIILAALAIAQLIAQVIFFLRMNVSEEGLWNLMPFLFTILIVAVIAGGSLWIMYNLNYNMMN